jgi:hypothetical protein
MELLFILLVATIGGAMIRIDYTLSRLNRNLEEIAASLRPRKFEVDRADQP